jgi:molybdopterin/thiamine biosynthesis adenylyltransferase
VVGASALMIRLAVVDRAVHVLLDHFGRKAGLEEGAFCLVREGRGIRGTRLLITEVLSPPTNAWDFQGAGVLRPSAQWTSAAVSRAIAAKAGLMFIHSHPDPRFPIGFSPSDTSSFISLAKTLAPMLAGPFVAVVAHPQGWSGYIWLNKKLVPIASIASIGAGLRFLSPMPHVVTGALDARQKDALGAMHDVLRGLIVAVVGTGGLGSVIAEQLVRMGVREIILIDFDVLDTDSNIRRVFGARIKDLRKSKLRTKVEVVTGHLKRLGFDVSIRSVSADIRVEQAFRETLDADVVLCATDTHASRATVNELASTYLLPVVDVGVRVAQKTSGSLSGLFADIRLLTPSRPCLWCRGTINADTIRAENLPQGERRRLITEGYVVNGFGVAAPSVVTLTVMASGLATSALLGLLSGEADVIPSGYWVDGLLGDSRINEPSQPNDRCLCRQNIGLGDAAVPPFIDAAARDD